MAVARLSALTPAQTGGAGPVHHQMGPGTSSDAASSVIARLGTGRGASLSEAGQRGDADSDILAVVCMKEGDMKEQVITRLVSAKP
jgi:hypothetical protein